MSIGLLAISAPSALAAAVAAIQAILVPVGLYEVVKSEAVKHPRRRKQSWKDQVLPASHQLKLQAGAVLKQQEPKSNKPFFPEAYVVPPPSAEVVETVRKPVREGKADVTWRNDVPCIEVETETDIVFARLDANRCYDLSDELARSAMLESKTNRD